MCTILDAMELVRNLGQVDWAIHRMWLVQLGQATEFRISYKAGPQQVDETFKYLGPKVSDHYA